MLSTCVETGSCSGVVGFSRWHLSSSPHRKRWTAHRWLWHQEPKTPWFTETPTKLDAPPFDATTEQPGTAAPEPDHSRCMPQDFRLTALGFEKARVMGVGLLSGVIANGRDIRSLDRA